MLNIILFNSPYTKLFFYIDKLMSNDHHAKDANGICMKNISDFVTFMKNDYYLIVYAIIIFKYL